MIRSLLILSSGALCARKTLGPLWTSYETHHPLSTFGGNLSFTVVAVMSLRRSGISDLLGLLALLTIGLEGGRLWLPITLQLALREGIRPSRSSRSPVLVGLRLGCMTGMEGPPLLWRTAEHRHTGTRIRNILNIQRGTATYNPAIKPAIA